MSRKSRVAADRGEPSAPASVRRRLKTASVIDLVLAVGLTAFWAAFFLTDLIAVSDPRLRDVYLAYESAFPAADIILAVILASGGIGLLRGKAYGRLFSLAGGGALVFLGLLDIAFNVRQGIYLLGPGEAVLNGTINLACLASGVLLIRSIWIVAIKDDGRTAMRPGR